MIRKTTRKLALAAFLAIVLGGATGYPATDQAVQDEQIRAIQKHLEYDDARLNMLEQNGSQIARTDNQQLHELTVKVGELQESVFMWKGVVFAFGLIISFIELLQAVGVIRYKAIRHAPPEIESFRGRE